jgi:hypothetical protein
VVSNCWMRKRWLSVTCTGLAESLARPHSHQGDPMMKQPGSMVHQPSPQFASALGWSHGGRNPSGRYGSRGSWDCLRCRRRRGQRFAYLRQVRRSAGSRRSSGRRLLLRREDRSRSRDRKGYRVPRSTTLSNRNRLSVFLLHSSSVVHAMRGRRVHEPH